VPPVGGNQQRMDTKHTDQVEMNAIRAKLEGGDAGYWKSLEQVAESPEYSKWVDDEFPHRDSIKDVDRRTFLKVMGASLALAGLAGCRNLPQDKLVPYVKAPEDRIPGKSLYYASAFSFGGYANGVLVQSFDGRPTKIEGNPDHPASLGSADAFTLSHILNLYDPDRQAPLTHNGLASTWDEFLSHARTVLKAQRAAGGSKVRILSETVTSPTLIAWIEKFIKANPGAKWHSYESLHRDNVKAGSQMAFGENLLPIYDLAKASCIVSLDADLFHGMPGSIRYARDFASRRDLADDGRINRLYAFQTAPNLTGSAADHTWSLKPSDLEAVALALAARFGANVTGGKSAVPDKVLDAIVADLKAHQGEALVVAGDQAPASVHAACHAINAAIGAFGSTVKFADNFEGVPGSQVESLQTLVQDMRAGAVDVLIILGGNPAYSAPSDLKFGEAMRKVANTWRLSSIPDETSELSKWHLPQAHELEAWGDARAYDGTVSIVQPLIEPLFNGKSSLELIAALSDKPIDGLTLVQEAYEAKAGAGFDTAWQDMLNNGVLANSAAATKVPALKAVALNPVLKSGGIEAILIGDPTVRDGSFANNGWQQEMPKPLTKLTWDNAVHMSPKTADQLGVAFEERVTVTIGDASVVAPVFVQPGHPDDAVTLHLGYGREKAGKVGTGTGFNFGLLRTSDSPYHAANVTIAKAGGKHPLASAQMHHSMEGRDIVREGSLAEFKTNPSLTPEGEHVEEDPKLGPYYNLSEEWAQDKDYAQWGMAIDLNTCIGCNACAIACQSENNIPTVGKIEVQRGREMHWIRIDRYYRVVDAGKARDVEQDGFKNPHGPHEPETASVKGDVLDPNRIQTVFQPIPCMHCETAPCEPVCPVAATVHSHEGLNQMVYNRCVGTRYCSNNCPYKVRRFNYHNYQIGQNEQIGNKPYGNRNFQGSEDMPLLKMISNPNVTVRSRGVMEKCTYCVQRINQARIDAKKELRAIKDGEIVTACQQACPTQAITFGNIADPNSMVRKKKSEKRNYSLLRHLNTVPRTTYLGKVRNPNLEVEA